MVFERMQWRNTVSWTVMLVGYVEVGEEQAGLDVLEASADHVIPDAAMFVAALKACSSLAAKEDGFKLDVLDKGMALHSRVRSCGYDGDVFVAKTLVDMYAKCRSLRDSRIVFDKMPFHSVVSWNSLILAYAENGEEELALACFSAAAAISGSQDHLTYVAALKACTSLASKEEAQLIEDGTRVKLSSLDRGMELHSRTSKHGYDGGVKVANILVDMYWKCGSLVDARRTFDRMPYSSFVSWNSLLLGYADNGESEVALGLFTHLQTAGYESCDARTYVALLKACSASNGVSLSATKSVHAAVCRSGLLDNDSHNVLVSCLVNSYAKSGRMVDSQQVFDSMNHSSCIITWNSLMAGYCAQGDTKAVLAALHRMQDEGLQPDAITLVSILCACGHTGHLETAKAYFNAFLRRSDVKLGAQHYHCMLDALGRGNRFEEAIELVESMPFVASGVAWNSLLGACCKWNNVEAGKVVFDRFVKSESGSSDSAGYMLMVKLFGSAGLWMEQTHVLKTMSNKLKVSSIVP